MNTNDNNNDIKSIDDYDSNVRFQHRFNWLVRFKMWFNQLWTNSSDKDKDTSNVNE